MQSVWIIIRSVGLEKVGSLAYLLLVPFEPLALADEDRLYITYDRSHGKENDQRCPSVLVVRQCTACGYYSS